MFAEYVPQQYREGRRQSRLFPRQAASSTEIVYRFIPSDSSRDLAFQSGEVDMILGRQEQAWVDRMTATPGVKVVAMGPAEMSVIHLNMSTPPSTISASAKRSRMRSTATRIWQFRGKNISRPAVSVVPSGYAGTDEKAPLLPYDVAKAKELLAEAGYPNGVTIKAINTTLPSMLSFTEAVQAQLRRAGITLDIQPVDHATFHQQIRQDLSQFVHFQAARFPVADVYLTQFFHSRSTVKTPTAVTNFSHCAVADKRDRRRRAPSRTARSRSSSGRPRRRRSSRRSARSRSTRCCSSGPTRIISISAMS